MVVKHLIGPSSLSPTAIGPHALSIFSYNVLLPNSQDGWWTYKMYNPPLSTEEQKAIAAWDYRRDKIRERVAAVDAGIVCLQEVSPESFEQDFAFMEELGYDCREMFKKGRFRPATFWKSSDYELVADPVHKDRTLLTAFRPLRNDIDEQQQQQQKQQANWYVLNCHLQAGPKASRRVRQIHEGMRAVLNMAKKLKGTLLLVLLWLL
jgi:mRNA deadenylase 3'-5' endonuclease subunit Ccr4